MHTDVLTSFSVVVCFFFSFRFIFTFVSECLFCAINGCTRHFFYKENEQRSNIHVRVNSCSEWVRVRVYICAGLQIGKVRMEKKKTPCCKRCAEIAAAAFDHHCKEDARMRVTMAFCGCTTHAAIACAHTDIFGIKGSRFRHNRHSFILKLVLNSSIESSVFIPDSSWEFW